MLRSPIIHRRLFMLVVWAGFPKRQRHQSTGRTLGGCISGHGAAGSPRFEDLRAVLVGSVRYKQAGESWWVRRGWAIDQARPLLSLALDQEPSGAATIWKHGAKKCRKHGSKVGRMGPLGFSRDARMTPSVDRESPCTANSTHSCIGQPAGDSASQLWYKTTMRG